jgi:hypothetical protein
VEVVVLVVVTKKYDHEYHDFQWEEELIRLISLEKS